MTTYVLANIHVIDGEKMKAYSRAATPIVARFGGHYLVRGGAFQVLEGGPTPERLVIIEFPNREAVDAWWNSPDYQLAKAMRNAAAHTDLIVIDGLV